MILYTFIH